ncbi:MAG: exonuclease SbcCD subunit D [Clostridium sp.]|nr:exonuclease SbcCD subunit D [Clostridium sp.]
MKLIHLSDLHLGKRVHEFSMLEEQSEILQKILAVVDEEQPDAVLIAGDVYDKSVPSVEAVALFDEFLVRLSERKLTVIVISGNHDCAERLSFGGRLMTKSGIRISPVYRGAVEPVTLHDAYGSLHIYPLPFVKPAHVRGWFPDETIESYTDALRVAVKKMNIDRNDRNVLVTHQFVTGANRSDSEEISVGGSDNVDASVFDGFDYVALGHLHTPQNCGDGHIRYCGTPLKYSFSEAGDQKTVSVVTLAEKGTCTVRAVPLMPAHDMKEIRGTYEELTQRRFYEQTSYPEDYLHITLTDEEDIPNALGRLRTIYHRLMRLDYDNRRTRNGERITGTMDAERKTPLALFEEFYEKQNGQPMNAEQTAWLTGMVRQIWE